MNTETYSLNYNRFQCFDKASNAWQDQDHSRVSKEVRHLTCTESLGPLVGSQKRPGVLQVGHQADMQRGTGVGSQQSQQRSPSSLPMKTNSAPRGCNRAPRIKAVFASNKGRVCLEQRPRVASQHVSSSFLAFASFYSIKQALTSKSATFKN